MNLPLNEFRNKIDECDLQFTLSEIQLITQLQLINSKIILLFYYCELQFMLSELERYRNKFKPVLLYIILIHLRLLRKANI